MLARKNNISFMQTVYFLVFSFISWIRTNVINSSLRLSVVLLLIFGSVLYYLDMNRDKFFNEFQQEILIQAHGLLFDLVVVAIIFEVTKRKILNNNQVKILKNNLLDYRLVNNVECKYLIVKTLRELCEIKSVCIDASELELSEAKFEHLNFLITDFGKSNLSRISFLCTKFYDCDFSESILSHCDFSGSTIRFPKFDKCQCIDEAIFASTYITDDCKSYLESVLSEKQLRNIIWINSKMNIQDFKAYFKASIITMDRAINMPRSVL